MLRAVARTFITRSFTNLASTSIVNWGHQYSRPYKRSHIPMATMQRAELRRHKDRGLYDIDAVSALFADCHFAHVSYVRDDVPQCLPMIALVHTIGNNTAIYLHGHPSAGLMEIVRGNPKDADGNEIKKVKVCVTATKGMLYGRLLLVSSDLPSGWPSPFFCTKRPHFQLPLCCCSRRMYACKQP